MAKTLSFPVLLDRLQQDFPTFSFEAGEAYCWSPSDKRIVYKRADSGSTAVYSLLHELGHALLDHKHYHLDFELLDLEVAAWQKACQVAPEYHVAIDGDHIQDCLDTYRDWLYGRSICPSCDTKTLQHDSSDHHNPNYRCYNCHATWNVTPSRFCRPYRSRQAKTDSSAPVFA